MPIVEIKGVGKAKFPDDMPITDIRNFLRKKYFNDAISNEYSVPQRINTAEPYSPSLSERLGDKVASALTDSGIISNKYGAQQIGKNLASIGDFLPGIGDATAGDEFGRAVAEGDKLGIGVGLLGAIPVVGDAAKKIAATIPDKIVIDGVSRATRDSNGDLLGESIDEIKDFWKWFGDSSVVDSKDRPKVVYHGTNSDFDEFDINVSDGFWFTDSKDLLESGSDEIGASGSGKIIPAYLNIKNSEINGPNYDIEDYLTGSDYDGIENIYDYGTDYSVITNAQIRRKQGAGN